MSANKRSLLQASPQPHLQEGAARSLAHRHPQPPGTERSNFPAQHTLLSHPFLPSGHGLGHHCAPPFHLAKETAINAFHRSELPGETNTSRSSLVPTHQITSSGQKEQISPFFFPGTFFDLFHWIESPWMRTQERQGLKLWLGSIRDPQQQVPVQKQPHSSGSRLQGLNCSLCADSWDKAIKQCSTPSVVFPWNNKGKRNLHIQNSTTGLRSPTTSYLFTQDLCKFVNDELEVDAWYRSTYFPFFKEYLIPIHLRNNYESWRKAPSLCLPKCIQSRCSAMLPKRFLCIKSYLSQCQHAISATYNLKNKQNFK